MKLTESELGAIVALAALLRRERDFKNDRSSVPLRVDLTVDAQLVILRGLATLLLEDVRERAT